MDKVWYFTGMVNGHLNTDVCTEYNGLLLKIKCK